MSYQGVAPRPIPTVHSLIVASPLPAGAAAAGFLILPPLPARWLVCLIELLPTRWQCVGCIVHEVSGLFGSSRSVALESGDLSLGSRRRTMKVVRSSPSFVSLWRKRLRLWSASKSSKCHTLSPSGARLSSAILSPEFSCGQSSPTP